MVTYLVTKTKWSKPSDLTNNGILSFAMNPDAQKLSSLSSVIIMVTFIQIMNMISPTQVLTKLDLLSTRQRSILASNTSTLREQSSIRDFFI